MNHSQPAEGLDQARQAFSAAVARRDARAAAAAYAEQARLLPPLVDLVEGRDQILAFWQAGVDSGIAGVDLQPFECIELPGVAYEVGRYAISTSVEASDTSGHVFDSARVVERGRYLTVHRLIDGRWQRAVEMLTSDHQPGENRS